MIRGFEILLDDATYKPAHHTLTSLLSFNDAKNHYWYVENAVIDLVYIDKESRFSKEWMTSEDVILGTTDPNLCGFIELALIRYNEPSDRIKPVLNYEGFLNSSCSMAIVICDWYHMTIYVKDIAEHNLLLNFFEKKRMQYKIVTDENDGRTGF